MRNEWHSLLIHYRWFFSSVV